MSSELTKTSIVPSNSNNSSIVKSEKDKNIIFFSRITDFVSELSEMYGNKYHSLLLYKHMLYKTNINHKIKINKNIELFTSFLNQNKTSILSKDVSKLSDGIVFSKNIYIPLKTIINNDKENKDIIFQHLIVLLSCVDTSKEVNDVLNILNSSSNEGNFFNTVLNKIEKSVSPEEAKDPATAISSLMKGDVFQDIIKSMSSGVKDGSLDIGKMFGMVQGLVGNLSPEMGSMFNQMTSSFTSQLKQEDSKK